MAYRITREDVWAGEIEDRSGGLAEKLEQVSKAEANLEFLIARRAAEKPGTGVVFMAPLRGEASARAARQAGLTQWTSSLTLRIEGPDRPGLAALVASTVAGLDISMRGVSGAKLSDRSVFYLAFDSPEDAGNALEALNEALNG